MKKYFLLDFPLRAAVENLRQVGHFGPKTDLDTALLQFQKNKLYRGSQVKNKLFTFFAAPLV